MIPSLLKISFQEDVIYCLEMLYGQHGYAGLFAGTLHQISQLSAFETIHRHAQGHAIRNAADCPKVLIFHNVSMSKQAIGFENYILKYRSKSVGENITFFSAKDFLLTQMFRFSNFEVEGEMLLYNIDLQATHTLTTTRQYMQRAKYPFPTLANKKQT